jgi:hypothetical protein
MRPSEKQRLLKIAIAKETLRKVKSGESLNNISAKQVVSHYDGEVVDVTSSGQVTRIEDLGSTNVARAVDEIVITWRKTAESFIETALTLKRYKSYSNWRDIEKELEKVIPISSIKYLLAISSNSVLTNKRYTEKLPQELMKIYRLSMIDESTLETKLKRNEVTPAINASVIKNWTKTEPRRVEHLVRKSKVAVSMTLTLKITIPIENYKSNAKKIKNDIKSMYEGEDYDVVLDEKIKANY